MYFFLLLVINGYCLEEGAHSSSKAHSYFNPADEEIPDLRRGAAGILLPTPYVLRSCMHICTVRPRRQLCVGGFCRGKMNKIKQHISDLDNTISFSSGSSHYFPLPLEATFLSTISLSSEKLQLHQNSNRTMAENRLVRWFLSPDNSANTICPPIPPRDKSSELS